MTQCDGITATDLAHRLVALLDSASFDTTYKLATLEALIRVVSESVNTDGSAVGEFSARKISTRVLDRYWNQTANFSAQAARDVAVLRQRGGGQSGDLVSRIAAVRLELDMPSRADSLLKARKKAPNVIAKLEDFAWERVVDMPLPRLQKFGSGAKAVEDRFLYDYGWGEQGQRKHVSLARQDDTIRLRSGVAAGILQLQPLLLRHIEAVWVGLVADWNPNLTDAARLREALFGGERLTNAALAQPLVDLQMGKCFYCEVELTAAAEVDHFLPWSVTHNDNVENLVVACRSCNSKKSDSLASIEHLVRWRTRLMPGSAVFVDLTALAEKFARGWDPTSSLGQARSLYFYAAKGQQTWSMGDHYLPLDSAAVSQSLGS